MKIYNIDYFDYIPAELFNGIITDPPFKSFNNLLNGKNLSIKLMFKKFDNDTKDDSFLISFCNIKLFFDLIESSKDTNFKFKTYQIWNKLPVRTWISWSYPLRHNELIAYFSKGNFKFDFKDLTVKKAYKRSSFGGKLKNTTKNKNKLSYGVFPETITYKNDKNKSHPTEKPIQFSRMFKIICKNIINPFVLDPFAGTGNLIKMFSNSIGIEINKKYIK